jgi:hypothetical protein
MPVARSASTSLLPRFSTTITRWQAQLKMIFNPYRPELHYMRGPGPKCRAKQRRVARAGA